MVNVNVKITVESREKVAETGFQSWLHADPRLDDLGYTSLPFKPTLEAIGPIK